MTITLTLVKPLIIEAVKNETFLTGQVQKAADQKLIVAAYHEQAGDDNYQNRLLERGLYTALEELKTFLSDYIATSGFSAADNSIGSSRDGDNILVILNVSERFNTAYTQSLARLASKYIEESMLVDWWKPINEKQSALYERYLERDLAAIRRCFNKKAPAIPTVPYTSYLQVDGSAIELAPGEEATVTYTLSDGAVDDIEAETENPTIVTTGRSEQGFTVKGKNRGHTFVRLYSRHNEEYSQTIQVFVTDHS